MQGSCREAARVPASAGWFNHGVRWTLQIFRRDESCSLVRDEPAFAIVVRLNADIAILCTSRSASTSCPALAGRNKIRVTTEGGGRCYCRENARRHGDQIDSVFCRRGSRTTSGFLGEGSKQLKLDVELITSSHGRRVLPSERPPEVLEGKVQAPPVSPPKTDVEQRAAQ